MVRFLVLPACALFAAAEAQDYFCCYDGCDQVTSASCEATDSWCGQAQSNCETCTGEWCPGIIPPSPTPTPTPTPPVPPPTPTPPTPPAPPGSKTPMYVVLRMDDISIGYVSEQQQQAISWAQDNSVKFSFGIIAGSPVPWPTTCAESPSDQWCDDLAVKAVYDAYAKGNIVGTTGGNPVIELFDHSWAHETWADKFYLPQTEFKAWMEDDMNKSTTQLRNAFPEANIVTMVAPQNLANMDVLTAMQAHGLSILSTQGTLGCHNPEGSPPHYNYYYGPCEHDDQLDCVPPNDVYVTSEGWQKVKGIFSTPSGSGSSTFVSDTEGITAEQAWGEGTCGCQNNICSVVSAAEQNADKSNGLRWAVLMMHPQNQFPGGQPWNAWLDDLLAVARASPNYDVHFLTFQDLVKLKAPNMEGTIAV